MKFENYTDVKLKNGQEGCIVEVFEDAYFVDISNHTYDDPEIDYIKTVKDCDIEAYWKDGTWNAI